MLKMNYRKCIYYIPIFKAKNISKSTNYKIMTLFSFNQKLNTNTIGN